MPLGVFRTGFYGAVSATGGPPVGGGLSVTTLDSTYTSTQDWGLNSVSFCGTNSSDEPVFMTLWSNGPAGTSAVTYYQMFSIANDATVTSGTTTSLGSSGFWAPRGIITEKDVAGAGWQNESTESDYGVLYYYDYNATNKHRIVAFSYDNDTLSASFGTPVDLSTGSDANSSLWDITYLGSGHYVGADRGGNNDSYMIANTFTRSGTSLTLNDEDLNIGYVGGMAYTKLVGYSGNKFASAFRMNNADGIGIGLNREYSNNIYWAGTDQIYQELGNGGELNCGVPSLTKLDNTSLFAVSGNNSAGGQIGTFMRVGDATWNSGTTKPTGTFTSMEVLDTTSYTSQILPNYAGDGGRVYIANSTSGTWQYKTFSYSGGSLSTDTSWIDTAQSLSINGAPAQSYWYDTTNTLNYDVIVYRDSSNYPTVFVNVF